MAEVKYFQAQINHIVSNGKLKFKFSQEVLRVDNPLLIQLLGKSQSVKEVSEEEAEKLNPSLFENYEKEEEVAGKKPSTKPVKDDGTTNETDAVIDLSDMTKPELKEEGKKLGLTDDDMKEPILKDDLIALIVKTAEEKAAKEKAAAESKPE